MSTTPTDFQRALAQAINAHSREAGSNTPDFILACYLDACLQAWELAHNMREAWYQPDGQAAAPSTVDPPAPYLVEPEPIAEHNITAAAQTLAAAFDYPWDHMPEAGRQNMRAIVLKVLDAARIMADQPTEGVNHDAATVAPAEPVKCPCGATLAEQCPEQWEPGCDLGNNEEFVRVVAPTAAQPQPLTDEQISTIYAKWVGTPGTSYADLMRAIESACAAAWGVKLGGER